MITSERDGPADVQTVMAQVRAKPAFVETVKRACLVLVASSRSEKGCLVYELYQSTDDATVFIFYEKWESRQDIERHLETAHALAFDEETAGLLAEEEAILYLQKLA